MGHCFHEWSQRSAEEQHIKLQFNLYCCKHLKHDECLKEWTENCYMEKEEILDLKIKIENGG